MLISGKMICSVTGHLGHVVDVDLGEDDLLGDTDGVVAAAVEFTVDTLEVADTRQGDADETLHELVHAVTAQGNANADGHFLADLEVGDILLRQGSVVLIT